MGKLDEVTSSFEDSGSSGGSQVEYAKEVKVSPGGGDTILRFLDGEDSFLSYHISWIMCDDEKIRPFIIKNEVEGESLLWKMFGDKDKYYQGGYFQSTRSDAGGKAFTYQTKDPELFKLMTEYWNPSYNNKGTALPREEFIFNVIHRNPENIDGESSVYCEKEKHTKVIRLNKSGLIALQVVKKNDGDVSHYDINFTKTGSGLQTVASMMKAGINLSHVVTGPVTDAERAYTKNVLPTIIKLSSAFYVLKHIPSKIKRMDAAMGTNFFPRYEQQAAEEAKLWEEKKNKSQDNSLPSEPMVSSKPVFDDSKVPSASPQIEVEKCSVCNNMMPKGSKVCPFCKAEF